MLVQSTFKTCAVCDHRIGIGALFQAVAARNAYNYAFFSSRSTY